MPTMSRAAFALVIVTAWCAQSAAPATAQTASPDTQALQALVAEIRQLRLDMQATTIATQRVQIVLYRLQMQTTLMTRASSRLDDVRSSMGNLQSEKKNLSLRVQQMEESLKSAQNPAERKTLEDWLANAKPNAERIAADEQRLQSREIDAETQLRAEQAKLAGLQDQLDRLDQLLDSFTRKQP
jgi:chromosome segregation ATPase